MKILLSSIFMFIMSVSCDSPVATDSNLYSMSDMDRAKQTQKLQDHAETLEKTGAVIDELTKEVNAISVSSMRKRGKLNRDSLIYYLGQLHGMKMSMETFYKGMQK